MTLAERLRKEGIIEGLIEGIELAIILKFKSESEQQKLFQLIRNIKDINKLKKLKSAIIEMETTSELIEWLLK